MVLNSKVKQGLRARKSPSDLFYTCSGPCLWSVFIDLRHSLYLDKIYIYSFFLHTQIVVQADPWTSQV